MSKKEAGELVMIEQNVTLDPSNKKVMIRYPAKHSCINSGNAELCGQAPPVFGLILPINQQNLPFLPDLKGDF